MGEELLSSERHSEKFRPVRPYTLISLSVSAALSEPVLPDVHIIIVSYNSEGYLPGCLNSLPAACENLSFLVTVVDNASTDRSVSLIEEDFPWVRLIEPGQNLGFPKGNNIGMEGATARYTLLLNPDTECLPGSVTALVRFMEDHPQAGACGPKLLNTDGSLQPNGGKRAVPVWELLVSLGVPRLAPKWFDQRFGRGRTDLEATAQVEVVSGAAILLRREALDQVGGLDERIFMYYEEIDWCKRAALLGWEVWFVGEAEITHHWMGSVRTQSWRAAKIFAKSALYYYRKHHGSFSLPVILISRGISLTRSWVLWQGSRAKQTLRRVSRGKTA